MARREMFEITRVLCGGAMSLGFYVAVHGAANAQVNADKKIHCTVQGRGAGSGHIDILVDFQHNTINGAPADGRFRKEGGGDLNAYSIFSGNFILNVDSWTNGAGESGVRSINYITMDRIHSAIRATTVAMPDGRSTFNKGDCEVVAATVPSP